MDLHLIRLNERRYETIITRDDGVSFHVNGIGRMFAIPHDLAHYAIEGALHLARGFWGSVAAGAVFASMTHVAGRRKPRAALRSLEVLKANKAHIGEAEMLVSIFNGAIEQGCREDSRFLRQRLAEYWYPTDHRRHDITDEDVSAVFAAWRSMSAVWHRLPIGGSMDVVWSAGIRVSDVRVASSSR
jgi:hypothetical protein